MEEMRNLIKCASSVVASLGYCYFLVAKFPPGHARLLSLLPVFYLFSLLPWSFSTIHLRSISAFFLTWLANFKLFLFSFDEGPLSRHPGAAPSSFLRFISLASLPVKQSSSLNPNQLPPAVAAAAPAPIDSSISKHILLQKQDAIRTPHSPRLDLALLVKALLLGIIIGLYRYKHRLPRYSLLALYCLHMYLALEIVLAGAAALALALTRLELEPQFQEPFLSTSLQDFWGRRWNLMVTAILRPTVYHPVRRWAGAVAGPRAAQLLGILAVFAVSGIMHEAMFYYLTAAASPTWEVTCFFLLHGLSTATEVAVKKAVAPFRLPAAVSTVATLAFVAGTGFYLFFPPILRSGTDAKVIDECRLFFDFVADAKQRFLLH